MLRYRRVGDELDMERLEDLVQNQNCIIIPFVRLDFRKFLYCLINQFLGVC